MHDSLAHWETLTKADVQFGQQGTRVGMCAQTRLHKCAWLCKHVSHASFHWCILSAIVCAFHRISAKIHIWQNVATAWSPASPFSLLRLASLKKTSQQQFSWIKKVSVLCHKKRGNYSQFCELSRNYSQFAARLIANKMESEIKERTSRKWL